MMLWFVLTVRHLFEFEAARSLTQRGFQVYVPIKQKLQAVSRYVHRKKLVDYPLMTGYVFLVATDLETEWYQVLQAHHVRRVIAFENKPIKIPLSEMNDLKQRETDGEFITWSMNRHMNPRPNYGVGDEVGIITGPMTGYDVEIVDIMEETAQVLMEYLGSKRFVEIGLETLEKRAA